MSTHAPIKVPFPAPKSPVIPNPGSIAAELHNMRHITHPNDPDPTGAWFTDHQHIFFGLTDPIEG